MSVDTLTDDTMNDERRDKSIAYILDNGLTEPQPLHVKVRSLLGALGLRVIFWDTLYSMVFTLVTLAVIMAGFILLPVKNRYGASVALSPALLLVITLFAEMSERVDGLYDIKQCCLYNVRSVTAIRMMCYSAAGAVFAAVVAGVGTADRSEFLSMYSLCLSGLFMCACAELSLLRRFRGRWAAALPSMVWVIVSLTLTFVVGDWWERFLVGVPNAVSAVSVTLCAAMLIIQLKKMLREGTCYAFA
ncbi:hypothetical protein FACS1894184_02900 [Clostridia bacterium]|nr:hypothetical protein FACS1894184_02900 [Clostridia bacterium]